MYNSATSFSLTAKILNMESPVRSQANAPGHFSWFYPISSTLISTNEIRGLLHLVFNLV